MQHAPSAKKAWGINHETQSAIEAAPPAHAADHTAAGSRRYVLYSQSATALRDALVLNLEREAESMQRRTEDMLKTTMAHAQRAAKDPEILEELARADGPDLPALTGHLQALADSCPFMEFLGVADDKSMILATSKKGDAGRDASQRGSPERAIIGQKAELSGIYLNETSQRPFIDVAAPIVVNGKSIGRRLRRRQSGRILQKRH